MAKYHYVAKPTQITAEVWTSGLLSVEGVLEPTKEFPYHHTINAHGYQCVVHDGDYIVPEANSKGYYPVPVSIFESEYDRVLPVSSEEVYVDLRPTFPSSFVSVKGLKEPDYDEPAHKFIVTPSLGFENGESVWALGGQMTLQFVKKLEDGTVIPGLQTEQLLRITLMRHTAFQKKFPSKENACFITHIQEALFWLQERVQERIDRGVMGKLQA